MDRTGHLISAYVVVFIGHAFLSFPTLAQGGGAGPVLPGAVEPGREDDMLEDMPLLGLDVGSGFEMSLEVPGGVSAPAGYENETLLFNALAVKGVTAYEQEEIESLYKDKLGSEITFGDFFGIVNAIQSLYRDDGYFLSYAFIPPQSSDDGRFTLQVVEGFIDAVVVKGADPSLQDLAHGFAESLTQERPGQLSKLERVMLLINDLPGVSASSTLHPSPDQSGATQLQIDLKLTPATVSLAVDNRSSEYSGPWTQTGSFTLQSAFGLGERISATVMTSRPLGELAYGAVDVDFPIGSDGLRFGFGTSFSDSKAGAELQIYNIESLTFGATADLSYPVIRSRDTTWVVGTGFELSNSRSKLLGQPYNNDRIRKATIRSDFNTRVFSTGSFSFSSSIHQGFPFLGGSRTGSDDFSREDAQADFTKFLFSLRYAQRFWDHINLRFSLDAQTALGPLPGAEEFGLGGKSFGRAYDPSEILGDHGVAGALELGVQTNLDFATLRILELYGFYDLGSVWQDNTAKGGHNALSSGGMGVRLNTSFGGSVAVELARPLSMGQQRLGGDRENRLNIEMGLNF